MPAAVTLEDEIEHTFPPGQEFVDESSNERYCVLELVGRGGMGEVYRAVRLSDGAHCAAKCVRGDMVENKTVALRTRFEALAFRKISHPNVVRVHGTGILAGRVPWMCMDWLEGFTLAEIVELHGKIPIRWAVEIVRDLCCGLQAIHPVAVHRDIKPSNVHFGLDAVTRALDLGAAKPKAANVHLTSTGFQVGTVPFMAPEQLDNTLPVDHRADLWAAMIVLYMLITGVHPFAVGGALPASKIKLGMSILTDPHRPLVHAITSIPPRFARIIGQILDRGLAKEPDDRHRSAEELVEVLTALMAMLEAETEHAEPLSSLVPLLVDKASRGGAAPSPFLWAPSPRLWIPPRTTEIMPPPAPPKVAIVHLARTLPRTTEPMPAPAAAPVVLAAPLADAEPPRRTSAVVRKETRLVKNSEQATAPQAPRPRPTESTDRDTELPPESMLDEQTDPRPRAIGLRLPQAPAPVGRSSTRRLPQIAIFLAVVTATVGGGLGVLHALGTPRALVVIAPPASAVTPIAVATERPSSAPSASPPPAPAPSASASAPPPSPSTAPPRRPLASGAVAVPRPPPKSKPQPVDIF